MKKKMHCEIYEEMMETFNQTCETNVFEYLIHKEEINMVALEQTNSFLFVISLTNISLVILFWMLK